MVKKTISKSLVILFVGVVTIPLFADIGDCVMPCCQEIIPCCEMEGERSECPNMTQGREITPILLPVAPRPVTTEFYYLPYLSTIQISDFDSNNDSNGISNHSLYFIGSYLNIPNYLLTHSLLI